MSKQPKRASDPAGKPKKKAASLDLATARQMLPLVRSIVADIVSSKVRAGELVREQDHLDRDRRTLDWHARQRRYAVADERSQVERHLVTAVGELDQLGVTLTDADGGAVDFPARINGRSAAYSWRLGEDALAHWRYADEDLRRTIPADWIPTPRRADA